MFPKCPCVRDTILRVALLKNLRYHRNLRRSLAHFKGNLGLLDIFSFSSCLRDGQVLHGNRCLLVSPPLLPLTSWAKINLSLYKIDCLWHFLIWQKSASNLGAGKWSCSWQRSLWCGGMSWRTWGEEVWNSRGEWVWLSLGLYWLLFCCCDKAPWPGQCIEGRVYVTYSPGRLGIFPGKSHGS